MVAVAAAYHDTGCAFNDIETCGHRFVVGDALGIGAFYDARDGVGKRNGVFLHHVEIADDVDHGVGGDEGDAVKRGVIEFDVGDLDDALRAELGADEVAANSDGMRGVFEAKDADNLEDDIRGDVVDDRAAFEGGHCEFFFHAGYFLRGLMPRARVMMAWRA